MKIHRVGQVVVTERGIEISGWWVEGGSSEDLQTYAVTWSIDQLRSRRAVGIVDNIATRDPEPEEKA